MKLYLSPIMDLYNGEIVAYQIKRQPVFDLVGQMLEEAISKLSPDERPMIHSDQDRKSTRLNSSHSQISYAVFCLKKKKISISECDDAPIGVIDETHDYVRPGVSCQDAGTLD